MRSHTIATPEDSSRCKGAAPYQNPTWSLARGIACILEVSLLTISPAQKASPAGFNKNPNPQTIESSICISSIWMIWGFHISWWCRGQEPLRFHAWSTCCSGSNVLNPSWSWQNSNCLGIGMYGTPICRRERGGLPASSCVFFTPRHTELKRQSMRKWGSKGKSLCPCYRRMQRCLSEFVATNSAEVHALSCVGASRKSTYIQMDRAKLFREFLRESFIYNP
jgi:hypothetical protein